MLFQVKDLDGFQIRRFKSAELELMIKNDDFIEVSFSALNQLSSTELKEGADIYAGKEWITSTEL